MSEELEEEKTSWDTQPRRHSLCRLASSRGDTAFGNLS